MTLVQALAVGALIGHTASLRLAVCLAAQHPGHKLMIIKTVCAIAAICPRATTQRVQ